VNSSSIENHIQSISIVSNNEQSLNEFKSNSEKSLFAALRLMEECHLFLDSYFAAVTPSHGTWREETESFLIKQLKVCSVDENISCLGNTCCMAFHIVRSLEYVLIGKKNTSSPALLETAAERVKAKENAKKTINRPTTYSTFLPPPTISLIDCMHKTINASLFMLSNMFYKLSDFDTFELFSKAISVMTCRVSEDISILSSKCKLDQTDLSEEIKILRWKSGPFYINLSNDYTQMDTSIIEIIDELKDLLAQALNFFSKIDMSTLTKLNPSSTCLVNKISIDSKIDINYKNQVNHPKAVSVKIAKQLLKSNKEAGLTYKMPAPEWELRPRKIKKYLINLFLFSINIPVLIMSKTIKNPLTT